MIQRHYTVRFPEAALLFLVSLILSLIFLIPSRVTKFGLRKSKLFFWFYLKEDSQGQIKLLWQIPGKTLGSFFPNLQI